MMYRCFPRMNLSYLATNLKPPPCSLATMIAFSHSSLHSSYLPCSKYTAEITQINHNKNREKACYCFQMYVSSSLCTWHSFCLSDGPREWQSCENEQQNQSNSLMAMPLIFTATFLRHGWD